MKLFINLVVLFLFFGCSPEIENLTISKNRVAAYYENGAFEKELQSVIEDAIDKIEKTDLGNNPTAIFDVDETALSNYGYIEKYNFGYNYNTWTDWLLEEKSTQIKDVKKLYDLLIAKNVKIVFLTGRIEITCAATKNNLIAQGYTQFDTLICRSKEEQKIPTSQFKSAHRKTLTENGYNIIACIGDQRTDFEGGHTGIKVKIPNYLYDLN